MYFQYINNNLHWQDYSLTNICNGVEKLLKESYDYQGPYFLYNEDILKSRKDHFIKQFSNSRFYYSVKSLSNIHILKSFCGSKEFGLDVVSGAEILRGLEAGFPGDRIVYAGVGKTKEEIKLGLLSGIKSFHVESISEIKQIDAIAKSTQKVAPITLRLNANIGVDTHEYINTAVEETKFGISQNELGECLDIIKASKHLKVVGLLVHLGSQLKEVNPYVDALKFLQEKAQYTEGYLNVKLEYLSLGGGFGIDYEWALMNQTGFSYPLHDLAKKIENHKLPWRVDFEPGRYISGYAGILISRVLYIKSKTNYDIAIIDSGMSELIRPALYKSTHPILPIETNSNEKKKYDVVGPICESGDFFAKQIDLRPLSENDRLGILHVGAYGSVMSSNYNSRPFLPEVLLSNRNLKIIRRPQKPGEIFALELQVES